MNTLLKNIFFPHHLNGRSFRNRQAIEQFLVANKGNGKIFGLYKRFSSRMLFVSVSALGEKDGKRFAILHSFEPSGVFIANIQIELDKIDSICPFDNTMSKLWNFGSRIQKQLTAFLPEGVALA